VAVIRPKCVLVEAEFMVGPVFREFDFGWAYSIAGSIRELIFCRSEDLWLACTEEWMSKIDDQFKDRARNPNKRTYLHDVIDSYTSSSVECLVDSADYEDVERELRYLLDAYGISAPPKPSVASLPADSERDTFFDYVEQLHAIVKSECLPRVTDEVFTILFGDRALLRELNLIIAGAVKTLRFSDHPDLLVADGVVKRVGSWPEWVKSALLYRDRGRCALCLRDITGLLASGKEQHIDHIVALANGGTNDPTNLQYLCPSCNLAKHAGAANTSRHYSGYW
jgi:hypothetical protein